MNSFAVRPSSGPRPWLLIQFEGDYPYPYREFSSKAEAEAAAEELNNWMSYEYAPTDLQHHPPTIVRR
jgi:hypothetical protein